MKLSRNRASGAYFIYIDRVPGTNKGLFVTPLAEIKSLELSLFHTPVEQPECSGRRGNLVTDLQVHRYQKYQRYRQHDMRTREQERINQCTLSQLRCVVENWPPDKLTKLRELLKL